MRFTQTPLGGAWLVDVEPIDDKRGSFARTYDQDEFDARGMELAIVQANHSYNARAGTLRGMHYQGAPHGETKLVRCVLGAVYDVIIDLRPDSQTHRQWFGVELSAANGRAVYVPADFAHGFQSLEYHSEVHYLMGHRYVPEVAAGVRFDDPAFGIAWPEPPGGERIVSDRDRSYADYSP